MGKRKTKGAAGQVPPRILNAETVVAPVDSVQPHPRNVNDGDGAAIRGSIEANGFWGSLIVQRSTGFILAGNHRWQEAKELGYPDIPITYVDVDDAVALRILLADNRTGRLGKDDPAALADLLKEIHADAGSLVGTAYTDADLAALLKTIDPDEAGPNLSGGGSRYQEQYGVTVICASEADQEQLYNRLTGEGYECKVVCT